MRVEKVPLDVLLTALRAVAPGTLIREGIENILRAKTGGLLVIGDHPEVRSIVEGGFEINAPMTATKLYELAKMDGAIILDEKAENIWKANAQLVPQSAIASDETGIRHRIAERVARQTGAMVIAISQRRSIITLYKGLLKYTLPDISVILTKANQAIQTLEKYRAVLEKALVNLSVLEFEEVVTVMDVVKVVQRVEMVKRIVSELDLYLAQLGVEGRLVNMQMEELMANVFEDGNFVLLDYVNTEEKELDQLNRSLWSLTGEELLELTIISKIMGFGSSLSCLDMSVLPRGYRILNKIPRLPFPVIENLIKYFGSLQKILAATIEELDQVEGIGEVRAKAIKNGLLRLREQVFLDRHF
ncbi:MAG: DNA integrity scanning diadenylate cyclase DisA [Bacillota bacterium]